MQVTDTHMAALRALLTADDSYEDLVARLRDQGAEVPLGVLAGNAFTMLARRHWASGYTTADVINFVAEVRATLETSEFSIDPHAAELVLRAALTGEPVADGIDPIVRGTVQMLLLGILAAEQDFDEADLNQFLVQVRELSEQIPDATYERVTAEYEELREQGLPENPFSS